MPLNRVPLVALIFLSAASVANADARQDLSEIKRLMIQESISHYPGHCPCPYNLASNGSQCGGRSA